MSRLQKRLQERSQQGRKSFVAYLTAGDPSLNETPGLVQALVRGGADVIELGIPFSDPLADGPTNQRAAERALAAGANLESILLMIADIRRFDQETPLVVFSYLNPIYHMGFEHFAERAAQVGADAVLVVDLPPEEAELYRQTMQARGLDTIFLASPTSDRERLRVINQQSSGFVYYVSRTGVTGVQQQLSDTLAGEMEHVRSEVSRPVMVGFGISTPEQAVAAAALGDGIIIGSAIVRLIEGGSSQHDRCQNVETFTRSIRAALDRAFG